MTWRVLVLVLGVFPEFTLVHDCALLFYNIEARGVLANALDRLNGALVFDDYTDSWAENRALLCISPLFDTEDRPGAVSDPVFSVGLQAL